MGSSSSRCWEAGTISATSWTRGGSSSPGPTAAWLRRRQVSAWYAVVFGLFPGVLIAVRYDLSEALAYSLAALAVLLFDSPRQPARLLSGLVFGAAVLTRESVAVFAAFFVAME